MIEVVGSEECLGVASVPDPWVPLTISWNIPVMGRPLYLYVRGDEGGYLEIEVSPDSGALHELVVINLPPNVSRIVEAAKIDQKQCVPRLDLGLWPWKVTPDYTEPERADIDISEHLSYSVANESLALWFSGSPVIRHLSVNDVMVGISEGNRLVSIVAPWSTGVESQVWL